MASRPSLSSQTKAAFASRLRSIMAARGLTATETARRMSEHLGTTVSLATVSQYRSGRAVPRPRNLEALSSALGVESSELVADPTPSTGAESLGNAGRSGGGHIAIEDLGDGEVRLKIDQRVSWDVALKILDMLKRSKAE